MGASAVPTESEHRAIRALAVETRGLRKTYGSTLAVDSLDLQIELARCWGFSAQNGAGKTSVIRMLSTVVPSDGGTFSVAGFPHQPGGDPPPDRRTA